MIATQIGAKHLYQRFEVTDTRYPDHKGFIGILVPDRQIRADNDTAWVSGYVIRNHSSDGPDLRIRATDTLRKLKPRTYKRKNNK